MKFLSWKKILKILKNPRLTRKTHRKYIEQAQGYGHCATGELKDALIAAGYSFVGNQPTDISIRTLSHAFFEAIKDSKFDEAETIYNSLQVLAKGDPLP